MSANNNNSYEEIDEAEVNAYKTIGQGVLDPKTAMFSFIILLFIFQEEALLKSDDEGDGGKANINLNLLRPPSVSLAQDLIDDNSLLNDQLLLKDVTDGVGDENKELDDADLLDEDDDVDMLRLQSVKQVEDLAVEDDDDSDDDDDEEVDEELKIIKEFDSILKELEINQYAYDKYLRLCELSQ